MKTLLLSLVLALGLAAQAPVSRVVICTDAGANDTYTCTASPTLGAYTTGMRVRLYPNTANTGAATVNIDSLGAKTIVKVSGGIATTLADNDIRAGQYVELIYDGTNMQMQSQLGNAASGGGVGMVVSMTQATLAASTINWYGPFGSTTGQATQANYVRTAAPWPVACTAQKMYVNMGSAQPSGGSLTIALWINNADTALTCAVSAAGTSCNDTTHTVSIAAGDLVGIHATNGSSTGASTNWNVAWSCQ